ncbi:hypothetical protein [Blastococcus sp. CCUG 61487]|uniref:hypothetical protein n=1 Tax=Blastococcus sp. CCUG 61487 TaxID=1840703 RepID=UPI0010C0A309|nr:hypothetical protein [Blastococcus sp. CCUG 61487]TKJ25265.1 hypothetical protein A6V29_04385 [Blastococcus sp. CCUG 61487]
MKRLVKSLLAEAERLGYRQTGVNSKGFLVYAAPDGHEVRINPSASEAQVRELSKAMQKASGTYTPTPGRKAVACKDRAGRRRQLDSTRLAARRREVQAEHDAYLARIAGAPHLRDDPASLRRVEQYLTELDRLDSLMRAVPAAGDHQGRRLARHTAGAS